MTNDDFHQPSLPIGERCASCENKLDAVRGYSYLSEMDQWYCLGCLLSQPVNTPVLMRRFQLNRSEDVSGVSGTGIVAEGVQFSDGKCVLAWRTELKSLAIYNSMNDLMAIHGHGVRTRIEWIDQ